jgi:NHL repeat
MLGNTRGDAKGQVDQRSSLALRQRVHFGVALVGLLLLIGVSTALADEPGDAGPPSVETPAGLNPYNLAFYPGELTNVEAAEELPHVDLGRDEALELLGAVFGPALQNPAGIYDELDVEEFHADNVAVIASGEQPDAGSEAAPSDEPTLLTSTIPLATRNSAGEREAVDLSLTHVRDELQPVNPLVDVGIPGQLDQGISLPDTDIEISLVNAPADRAPSIAEKSTAFFPNVAPDTDLTIAPTPDGVETLTQLRSPDAPRSQTFELSLPGDAELVDGEAGGAKVIQDGKAIVVIPPPTAYDAKGTEVPVSLNISGNSMTVMASPPEDASYPVLVDPLYEQPYVWMWNHSFAGMNDWRSSLNDVASSAPWAFQFGKEGYIDGVGTFPGLSITTGVGTVPTVSRGRWTYYVPRYDLDYNLPLHVRPTSYIKRMMLKRLWFKVDGGTIKPITSSPGLKFGIWNEPLNKWTSEGAWSGTQGNLTNLDWEYNALNPDNQVGAKFARFELEAHEPQLQYRHLYVGEASIELSDSDAPEFSSGGSPAKWVDAKADAALPFTAVDPGLGVKEMVVKQPNGAQVATKGACTGIASNSCPRTWSSTNVALPPVNYAPNLLPQGENWLKVEAVDPIGHRSPEEGHGDFEARIKVDHTQPKLALSGSLAEHASTGITAPQYTLKYNASDGFEASATALGPILGPVGTGDPQVQRPMGVATDGKGNVWMVDRENNRVIKFNEAGQYLGQFGSTGTANGQFMDARGIAIAPSGNIWVSDAATGRIQQFSPQGVFLQKFGTKSSSSSGANFVEAYGLATTPGGKLWVADPGGGRVALFNAGEGDPGVPFIRDAYGTPANPNAADDLLAPVGLAADPSGNVWVTDNGAHRVQAYDPNGKFLSRFGSEGTAPGKFKNPTGIAVAPSTGHLLVADGGNNRIQEFLPNGVLMRQMGSTGTGNDQFREPRGVVFGANNTAFIADASNQRIARWSQVDIDPQSGVASTEVKVDGQLAETKYAPGCATKNCTISREWPIAANAYASGQHKVEVTTTDAVGLPTTKELTLTADSIAPKLTAISSYFTMPKGWVEQKTYSYSTSFSDVEGYGVTSVVYKLDGKVAASTTQSCPNGGCSATLAGSINMASYSGGAHAAELIATDAAGNVKKFTATVNVDPKGQISTAESVDTLEAMETTSSLNAVSESQEEENVIGSAPDLSFEVNEDDITAVGSQVPLTVSDSPDGGITVEVIKNPEAEELSELLPITIEPVQSSPNASDTTVIEGNAGVAADTGNHVDTIVRPLSDGGMTFENIRDAQGPETFSWEVQLYPEQELKSIDTTRAGIYMGEHLILMINAVAAHDAVGTKVPTKLSVSGANTVTLKVEHHTAGFVYPVIAGTGWEGGFQTHVVEMPPEEVDQEEEAEGLSDDMQTFSIVSAPEPGGFGDPNDATASSVATNIKKYGFYACATDFEGGCENWKHKIKGFFFFNGRYAWWKDRDPICEHSQTFNVTITVTYCNWIGPNHQPYGDGYHISSQTRWDRRYDAKAVSSIKSYAMTIRMFGSGTWKGHGNSKVCNPSRPGC